MLVSGRPKVVIYLEGDSVGKTSLQRRFCEDKFSNSEHCTIGYNIRRVSHDQVELEIWDFPGAKRLKPFTGSFPNPNVIMICGDLTDTGVVQKLSSRVEMLKDRYSEENPVYMFVGTKCDLVPQENHFEIKTFSDKSGIPFVVTSAKSNLFVQETFAMAVTLVASNRK